MSWRVFNSLGLLLCLLQGKISFPRFKRSPQAELLLVAVGDPWGPLKCSLQRRDCSLSSQAPDPEVEELGFGSCVLSLKDHVSTLLRWAGFNYNTTVARKMKEMWFLPPVSCEGWNIYPVKGWSETVALGDWKLCCKMGSQHMLGVGFSCFSMVTTLPRTGITGLSMDLGFRHVFILVLTIWIPTEFSFSTWWSLLHC